MAYWDAESMKSGSGQNKWHWQTIESDAAEVGTTALYHTTSQLPYMNGTAGTGYIVYNDQWCRCEEGAKDCYPTKTRPSPRTRTTTSTGRSTPTPRGSSCSTRRG